MLAFSLRTEANHEKSHLVKPVSKPRSKRGTTRLRNKNAKHSAATFVKLIHPEFFAITNGAHVIIGVLISLHSNWELTFNKQWSCSCLLILALFAYLTTILRSPILPKTAFVNLPDAYSITDHFNFPYESCFTSPRHPILILSRICTYSSKQ